MHVPSSDGVELELHDFGGRGAPLLLAHATGFCAGAYLPLASFLGRHFRVWALDFRGHGSSTRPADGDFDWGGMADDVLACVDVLGLDRVAAFGHSMGGAALLLAELDRPGLLTAAWLYEPIVVPADLSGRAGGGDEPEGSRLAESAARRRPRFASRAEAFARYASRPPLGAFRADALAAYVEHGFHALADGTVALRCSPQDESATFAAPGKPVPEQLVSITVPVTFAKGARDPQPGPATFAAAAHAALRGSKLRTYGHLGHFGPFQDPQTIAEDVAADLGVPGTA